MKITFQTPPKYLDEKMLYNVLRDYKILNCEVLVRDEHGESLIQSTGKTERLILYPSYNRRLYRCHYERSPQVHSLVSIISIPYE